MGMARYLVEAHLREGRSVAELAASHGVHRSWIYKLRARYRAEGEAGLEPRSRRPKRSPTKTAEPFVAQILALREQLTRDGFDAGAHTIHAHLSRDQSDVPSPSTIWRVLKAEGLVTPQPHKRPRSSYVRFCAELPNECWQTDITCWREVEIIGVIDDHSRLCMAARAFAQVKVADVVATFYEAASRFGLPQSLLSDNGAVYTAAPRRGRCAIESELLALGILYKHSRPPADVRQDRALPPDAEEAPGSPTCRGLAAGAPGSDRPLHRLLQRGAPAPGDRAPDAARGLRRADEGGAAGQRPPAGAPLPGSPRQGRQRRDRHAALQEPALSRRPGAGSQGPARARARR